MSRLAMLAVLCCGVALGQDVLAGVQYALGDLEADDSPDQP